MKTVIETKQMCFSVALVTSEAPAFQLTPPGAGNERNVSSWDQKHIRTFLAMRLWEITQQLWV